MIVIAPFLTSYLLRVLSFKVILTDEGLVNTFLFDTGLRAQGDQVDWLLYTQFTVLLVLLYAWVPFVALPIFVALENMDRRLLEAATDLGASSLHAFVKITLPLAAPGIVAAFLFVFIPTIGEFVTPQLVGGSKGYLFGSAIADDFGQNSDWQSGAVLALFLMLVVLLLTVRRRGSCARREAAMSSRRPSRSAARSPAVDGVVRLLPLLHLPPVGDPPDLLVQRQHGAGVPAPGLHDALVLGRLARPGPARCLHAPSRSRWPRACSQPPSASPPPIRSRAAGSAAATGSPRSCWCRWSCRRS